MKTAEIRHLIQLVVLVVSYFTSSVKAQSDCCEGFEYVHFRNPRTFTEASQECNRLGGYLAIIQSAEENERALDSISGSEKIAWIGLTSIELVPASLLIEYFLVDDVLPIAANLLSRQVFFDPLSLDSKLSVEQTCYYMDKDNDGIWFAPDTPNQCDDTFPYICSLPPGANIDDGEDDIDDNNNDDDDQLNIILGAAGGVIGTIGIAMFMRSRNMSKKSRQQTERQFHAKTDMQGTSRLRPESLQSGTTDGTDSGGFGRTVYVQGRGGAEPAQGTRISSLNISGLYNWRSTKKNARPRVNTEHYLENPPRPSNRGVVSHLNL